MFRISACALLLLCAALALGQQPQPQTSPQNQPTHNAQDRSDIQGTLRACAVLLMAATSAACPGETSHRQPQTNPQGEAANLQNQGDLQSTLRACAVLLQAATSKTCAQTEAASQQQPPPPQPTPRKNPQDKASTNSQILSNIQNSLNGDPTLSGTDVEVSVDDVNITLTGSVQSQGQLDRVLALASPYVGYRNVVNHVVIQ